MEGDTQLGVTFQWSGRPTIAAIMLLWLE